MQVVATFGHFSYGQIVIDKEGILQGVNVHERELDDLITKACGPKGPGLDLEGFGLTVQVTGKSGGRTGFKQPDGSNCRMRSKTAPGAIWGGFSGNGSTAAARPG